MGDSTPPRTTNPLPPARAGLLLDYFWTAITTGHGRQHASDGTTREVYYTPGQTRHRTFDRGAYLLHDLENIGKTELVFTTVEFTDSANSPLPLAGLVDP